MANYSNSANKPVSQEDLAAKSTYSRTYLSTPLWPPCSANALFLRVLEQRSSRATIILLPLFLLHFSKVQIIQ